MLILLGGLSGAGKSSLGEYLEVAHGFRWVELDPGSFRANLAEIYRIRGEWDRLYGHGDAAPLIARYPGNVIVTVPSTVIFREGLNARDVRVRYLVGTREQCLESAAARSAEIDAPYWDRYNGELLAYFDNAGSTTLKLEAFASDGRRRSRDDLAQEILSS